MKTDQKTFFSKATQMWHVTSAKHDFKFLNIEVLQ